MVIILLKSKRALITGITGQDGAYLAKFLLEKNYTVFGTFRRLSTPNFWRLSHLGIADKINYISADLFDFSSLIEAIRIANPDEIYHLAVTVMSAHLSINRLLVVSILDWQ